MSAYNWVPILGKVIEGENELTFKGGEYDQPQSTTLTADESTFPIVKQVNVGLSICSSRFTEGEISCNIEFDKFDQRSMADIVMQYDPQSEEMITVSLGGGHAFVTIRYWMSVNNQTGNVPIDDGQKGGHRWETIAAVGGSENIRAGQNYDVNVKIRGLQAIVSVNNVDVIRTKLPFQFPGLQVGVFGACHSDIHFKNFIVKSRKPQAFVVMQFNTPEYEALFKEVIQPTCEKHGLVAYRADFTHEPGIVVADITRQISLSRVIIAEITPVNANVYYEVGYADALNKPVILIADRKLTQLPFDVRPYRTIFYDNTIGGKSSIEDTLSKYLSGIMNQNSISDI